MAYGKHVYRVTYLAERWANGRRNGDFREFWFCVALSSPVALEVECVAHVKLEEGRAAIDGYDGGVQVQLRFYQVRKVEWLCELFEAPVRA